MLQAVESVLRMRCQFTACSQMAQITVCHPRQQSWLLCNKHKKTVWILFLQLVASFRCSGCSKHVKRQKSKRYMYWGSRIR